MACSFLQGTVWSVVSKMADSKRKTIELQIVNVLLVTLHFIVLTIFWYYGRLSLNAIFVAIIFEWSLACFFVLKLSKSESIDENSTHSDSIATFLNFCPFAYL